MQLLGTSGEPPRFEDKRLLTYRCGETYAERFSGINAFSVPAIGHGIRTRPGASECQKLKFRSIAPIRKDKSATGRR
jgi:hypothetical protein